MSPRPLLLVPYCRIAFFLGWVVHASGADSLIINEIHFNPDIKTEPAEFIELYNAGSNSVNLAGWKFTGGLDYVFPATNVAARGYVVVAQNPAFLQSKYSAAGALGPFEPDGSSGLSKYGSKLTLRNVAGEIIDEVEYALGFPWPTVGDTPGYSIELIHPSLDNNLGGSWRSSSNGVAHGPTPGRINSVYATNAPPQIRQVGHTPGQPRAGDTVTISAKVTDPDGVASVTLQYQVVNPGSYIELTEPAYTNAANWITVPMNDAGTNGDLAAGDDVFTALIPGTVQTHRRLIRYRITVTDTGGRSLRVPYADDPQPNFAYFVYNGVPGWNAALQPGATGTNGVVINYSSNVMGRLPVYHLIGKSNTVATATWFSRYAGDVYQWIGTLVYDGKVYDHVHYRARGGVWRYSMCKNMWKFDMNRGHDFEPRDNWGHKFNTPWTKLNLGACIQQGDYNHRGEQGMFESLGFRLFQLAGVAAPNTTFVTFRVVDDADEASPNTQYEGDFWGVYLAVEQEDSRFLEEHNLPDGNFYKMEGGTGTLNNQGPTSPSNGSDLSAFLNTYNSTTNASLPDTWWRTNLNLPKYYGYQTIVQGIHHYDIADGKNYFYYRNPVTLVWEVCTWDLDLTWADNMYRGGQQGGDEPFKSRVLSNFAIPGSRAVINQEFRNRVREIRDLLWNSDQAFTLIDEYAALLRGPTNAPTILDADRSMWDYNPKMTNAAYSDSLGKAGQGRFYQWPNEPTVAKNFNGCIQLLKNYVGYRATNAVFSMDTISADPARPKRPLITYTGPTNFPINRITFRSSNYSGSNVFASMRWRLGEVTDPASPNYHPDQPLKYEIETVWDSGPITVFNPDITIPANVLRIGSRYRARVLHTDGLGRNSNWSLPVEFTCGEPENAGDLLNFLRITEVMYNPPPAGYEFVELHNFSPTVTLDLAGVKFTQGIDYTFLPGAVLPPSSYLLVIGTTNVAAFRAYYGLDESVVVLAAYSGSLNNGGEQLTLRTSAGGTDIVSFNYSDGRGWPPAADGVGHSLVLLDSAESGENAGSGEYGANWRASAYLKGSPGRADSVPPAGVVLNEIVAHTDFTSEFDSNDWIELYNPTDSPITFGPAWYLSDDGTNLTKWQIPPTNVIPARGWLTFDEVTGFHHPTNIGFGLNKGGEQVFLSYLPGTGQDRVVDGVVFKGQENGWSLGRYPDGGPWWYALDQRTRNTANASPPLHIEISEVLYHPPDIGGTNDDSLNEFIELHNSTGGPVALFNTNGTWRLNGGVDFVFPTNLTLAANEYILAVNFSPVTNAAQLASFKALYGITNSAIRVFGPYGGKLANNSDRIALERPQHPDATNELVSWVIVDEVVYADQPPWPCGSDGTGNSLQRLNSTGHGSDPANWSAEFPTAGRPRAALSSGLAVIINQPQSRAAPTNGNASFSVSVCGTPPFTYQWQFNGTNISGATNATLNLVNVSLSDAGDYVVIISNPAGSIPSQPARLYVQTPPFITAQPQSLTVLRDQTAMFSVSAGGSAPLQYQWRLNGGNIGGATNDTLALVNVQTSQAGNYAALVFNSAGSVSSSNALLIVNSPPTITNQPLSQTTTNGSNVTFTVGVTGTGTMLYRWQFNGADLPDATKATLALTNVQLAQAGTYTVVVTDQIGSVTSQPAVLTVLMKVLLTQQPVDVVTVVGQNATFSVGVDGSPPIAFRWRRNNAIYLNFGAASNSITITNVTLAMNSNRFDVIITNVITPTGVFSGPAYLYVLAPDEDLDGDGMSNLQEYIAGTDPRDAASYLKIDSLEMLSTSNNLLRIRFAAVSNKTYTVFYRDGLSAPAWVPWLNVDAAATNRVVQLTNQPPASTPQRYFHLQTPRVP